MARSLLLRAGLYTKGYKHGEPITKAVRLLRPQYDQARLIRIGADADGGYLVPDDLDGIKACFSPGVDVVASFESDLAKRGIESHLCDASVEGPPAGLVPASFEKVFLGSFDNGIYSTLQAWFSRHAAIEDDCDYLLQMDIEGAEYDVITNTPRELLRKFRIVVIELHDLDDLFHASSSVRMANCFEKLNLDFQPVHLHPNNGYGTIGDGKARVPRVIEATYIRRDRPLFDDSKMRYPHPLDHKCVEQMDDIVLEDIFYR